MTRLVSDPTNDPGRAVRNLDYEERLNRLERAMATANMTYGKMADRGSGSAVAAGAMYYAYDYFGGAMLRSDGATWRMLSVNPIVIDLRNGAASYDLRGLNPSWEEGYDIVVSGVTGNVDAVATGYLRLLDSSGTAFSGWYENTYIYWSQDVNNANGSGQVVDQGAGLGFRFMDNSFNKQVGFISRMSLRTSNWIRSFLGDTAASPRANTTERLRYLFTGNCEDTTTACNGLRWLWTADSFFGTIEVRPRLFGFTGF